LPERRLIEPPRRSRRTPGHGQVVLRGKLYKRRRRPLAHYRYRCTGGETDLRRPHAIAWPPTSLECPRPAPPTPPRAPLPPRPHAAPAPLTSSSGPAGG